MEHSPLHSWNHLERKASFSVEAVFVTLLLSVNWGKKIMFQEPCWWLSLSHNETLCAYDTGISRQWGWAMTALSHPWTRWHQDHVAASAAFLCLHPALGWHISRHLWVAVAQGTCELFQNFRDPPSPLWPQQPAPGRVFPWWLIQHCSLPACPAYFSKTDCKDSSGHRKSTPGPTNAFGFWQMGSCSTSSLFFF